MSEGGHAEIVIIRRGGHGDHDDHHGGVWKIAFADFMTAMMAFFLVMWLISANDKTRASVAHYFNPVKLVDATNQPRGLQDPTKDQSGGTTPAESKDKAAKPDKSKEAETSTSDKGTKDAAAAKQKHLESALLDNPYTALSEIAADKGSSDKLPQDKHSRTRPVIGLRGGDQFRDPFAPPSPPKESDDEAVAALTPAADPSPPAASETSSHGGPTKQTKGQGAKQSAAKQSAAQQAVDREVADTRAQIAASLKDGASAGGAPALDVRHTAEGLLVSLTDTSDFSMFSSGSAVPSRRVLMMMERVAQVLKSRPGTIVIRGYTDNKPFHTARYDNWRLSLDRAQIAHYMLVRGGLPDARISHVEGYADHATPAGVDPGSAVNRRIEILIKDKGA